MGAVHEVAADQREGDDVARLGRELQAQVELVFKRPAEETASERGWTQPTDSKLRLCYSTAAPQKLGSSDLWQKNTKQSARWN